MEIERKFLLAELPPAAAGAALSRLRQGYLVAGPEVEVRVRDADGTYSLTVKSGTGMVREEFEIALDAEQFDELWPATDGRRVEKQRYTLAADGLRYEIDVYEGALQGLMTAEVEFSTVESAEAFCPPGWLGAEVTGDAGYCNAALATRTPGSTVL
ncbi:MAG: CYTH domain-containing protein [Coriobacteriia bacterium]|nr:CYTH domain-containing protein [Coriobacteriia bacterium]